MFFIENKNNEMNISLLLFIGFFSSIFGSSIKGEKNHTITNSEYDPHNIVQHLISCLEHLISRESSSDVADGIFKPIASDTRRKEIFNSVVDKFSFKKLDGEERDKGGEDKEEVEYYKYVDGVNKLCEYHTGELFIILVNIHDFLVDRYAFTDELYLGLPRGLVYSNKVLTKLVRESGRKLIR